MNLLRACTNIVIHQRDDRHSTRLRCCRSDREQARRPVFAFASARRPEDPQTRMPFDYQPTLKSDLLTLRPLREDDHDALYAVASDPLIWEQHPANRNEPEMFSSFFEKAMASGGALAAIDVATGRIIGTSRFHGYDAEKREVEIGWTFLARAYWGGRYNGEMKRLMMEHAFRFVASVVFLVAPENVRSRRAVEKIGGVRDGSRVDGEGRDSYVYRVVAASTEN